MTTAANKAGIEAMERVIKEVIAGNSWETVVTGTDVVCLRNSRQSIEGLAAAAMEGPDGVICCGLALPSRKDLTTREVLDLLETDEYADFFDSSDRSKIAMFGDYPWISAPEVKADPSKLGKRLWKSVYRSGRPIIRVIDELDDLVPLTSL